MNSWARESGDITFAPCRWERDGLLFQARITGAQKRIGSTERRGPGLRVARMKGLKALSESGDQTRSPGPLFLNFAFKNRKPQ